MATSNDKDKLFIADSILGDILTKDGGKIIRKWLIKWEDGDITYERKKNIEHLDIWKEYEENKQKIKNKDSTSVLFSKAKAIHQSNKDVAFGFIRKATNRNIPMPIKYLSLLYWNPDYDTFESGHKSVEIHNYGTSIIRTSGNGYKPAFLSHKVDFGINIWKFQINQYGFVDCIGIWNTEKTPTFHLDLSKQRENAYFIHFGNYSYDLEESGSLWQHDGYVYGVHVCEGDVVEMTLDLNRLCLSYKLNGRCISGTNKYMKPGKYQAAVSLSRDSKMTLISYQRIYKQ